MLLWFGLWILLLPFLLLFIFICTATQSNCEVFRAEICLCFLLKHSGLFCCLVIIHYVIALRFGWFKIAWCFSVYLKAFSCLWVIAVKHQIRLQIRSLPRVPFGSHPGRVVLTSGRNLGVPLLGEKRGIWVTGAFWNCFFCTFQRLLKVPWQQCFFFYFFRMWKLANFILLWSPKCCEVSSEQFNYNCFNSLAEGAFRMRAAISHWYLCTPGCCQHISNGPAMLQTSTGQEGDFLQVAVLTVSVSTPEQFKQFLNSLLTLLSSYAIFTGMSQKNLAII